MNKKEAITFLKNALDEIPQLRKLHYDNEDFKLWVSKLENVIKSTLGRDDYITFIDASPTSIPISGIAPESVFLDYYQRKIITRETAIKKIIQKYEILGIEEEPAAMAGQPPKVFIAHGGDSPALAKLKSFLEALGVQPLVVEEQASEGRSVGENVDWYSRQADCAIILATKGDIDGKSGGFIPRGNVLMEIGKLQELFTGRIIYLLQAGTKFPTNVSEKVRVRFSPQSMDNSFIKIAKELKEFGILKAIKPQE